MAYEKLATGEKMAVYAIRVTHLVTLLHHGSPVTDRAINRVVKEVVERASCQPRLSIGHAHASHAVDDGALVPFGVAS